MSLKLLKPAKPEDLFVQSYDLLIRRALALTGNNRAQAEDLVHDAFIQFTLRRSELGTIENIDAYLTRMLRNMNLSQVRRAAMLQESRSSAANFDSVEIGLRTIDPRGDLHAQDELRQICQYACARKETSKAGSVLILRFFHSYYPSEIAQVMRTNRTAVDRWLALARREAKVFLTDPTGLKFRTANPSTTSLELGYSRTTTELLTELRTTIFGSRHAACLTVAELKDLYRGKATIDGSVLAHIVSCESCIDRVNGLLGLPLLSERYADDRLGRDKDVPRDSSGGGDVGGSGGGSSIRESKRRYQRRWKEVFEHRPQELRIAVNGFVLGAQRVSSEFSKQLLTVNVDEPIGFIEVFSDQGMRLIFFDVDQPIDGNIEQVARVEFDCGRTLDLSLSFRGPWPTLNVSYHDPTFELVETASLDFEASIARIAAVPTAGAPPGATSLDFELTEPKEGNGFVQTLPTLLNTFNRMRCWLDARLQTPDSRLLFRPGVVTALCALLLIATVAVLYRRSPAPSLSATDLLQRATASEAMLASNRNQVLHRTLQLEERTGTGQLIANRRIEVWHSADKGITARRLYAESGELIAGDWRRADGGQTLYHHGAPPKPHTIPDDRGMARINFENAWLLSPTSREFSSLIGSTEQIRLEERSSAYVISYEQKAGAGTPGLLKASLTLSRTDLHATELTLLVAAQGSGLREFTFIEASFERHRPTTVPPAVFEPDPILLKGDPATPRSGHSETMPVSPRLPGTASPVLATAELEVEVVSLLNQANAFLGEQITVSRPPGGLLQVEGIVETEDRKKELLRALSPFAANSAVRIQIQTVNEAAARQAKQGKPQSVISSQIEITKETIPVDAELRGYLSTKKGVSAATLEQEIHGYSERVMARSLQARMQALALKQIVERFSQEDLRTLPAESRSKWLAMIRARAIAFQSEAALLRRELEPLFPALASAGGASGEIDLAGDAGLAQGVKRLFELAVSYDEGVSRSFTVAQTSQSAPVKQSQFWRSLREAEVLAGKIARTQ